MKKILYSITDFFFFILSILPKWILYAISSILFIIIYYLTGYRKKIVCENLKNAFPHKSKSEIKQIAKKYYKHLCDLVVEDGALIKMSKKKIQSYVKFENPEILANYYNRGNNIIMVFGHYGNWEFLASLPLHTDYQFLPVYKKINNKYLNDRFLKMRSIFGGKPIRMKETLKTTLDYYKRKEQFILALIADQRPRKKDVNYWIEFFNQDTPVFIGPEKIGKRIKATIIFVNIEKEKRGLYNIKFSEIIDNAQNSSDFEITKRFFEEMDKQISTKPEYWVWSHRRWKYDKSKFVNN